MKDTELYRHLLGLSAPWAVARVELSIAKQRVDVWAEHAADHRWRCPDCGEECGLHDHADERTWRHLDSCQFATYLHARPPRVACPTHGVRQVALPWAEPRARFTSMFERFAIEVLLEAGVSGASEILRISRDEAWHIVERAVARGLARKRKRVIRHLGIDETAAARGHKYVTVVCDLDAKTVEHVGHGRKMGALAEFYQRLSPTELHSIEAVAMDMWEAYIKATHAHVPDAGDKIVFDRFHVMNLMGTALDRVRKDEHRELLATGDRTLTKSKYLWLYAYENLPDRYAPQFDLLRRRDLRTARAWAIKENLRELWSCATPEEGLRFWKRWYYWATHSQLAPIRTVAQTLRAHVNNLLTFFRHRITNAVAEGINTKIQAVKRAAAGFRNADNFRTAIYFNCGGLQLLPSSH